MFPWPEALGLTDLPHWLWCTMALTKFPLKNRDKLYCFHDVGFHKLKLFSFRAVSFNSGPEYSLGEENSRTQHDSVSPVLHLSPPAKPLLQTSNCEPLKTPTSKTLLCSNILEHFLFAFICSFLLINFK